MPRRRRPRRKYQQGSRVTGGPPPIKYPGGIRSGPRTCPDGSPATSCGFSHPNVYVCDEACPPELLSGVVTGGPPPIKYPGGVRRGNGNGRSRIPHTGWSHSHNYTHDGSPGQTSTEDWGFSNRGPHNMTGMSPHRRASHTHSTVVGTTSAEDWSFDDRGGNGRTPHGRYSHTHRANGSQTSQEDWGFGDRKKPGNGGQEDWGFGDRQRGGRIRNKRMRRGGRPRSRMQRGGRIPNVYSWLGKR